MKTYIFIIVLILLLNSCSNKPNSGDWEGEGITFTVSDEGTSITKMEVLIPYEDEFLAQWYEDLLIENNAFSSFQSGNSFLGIPERDLKGEFISSTSAKGSLNGIVWEAKPKK